MSYILDALRRAQTERSRGSVPGLDTPTFSTGNPSALQQSQHVGLRGMGWVLATVLFGVLLVWWLTQPAAVQSVVLSSPQSPADEDESVLAQQQTVLPQESEEVPEEKQARVADASVVDTPSIAVKKETEAISTIATEPAITAVFALVDLPVAVRGQLPRLQLAGLTYSSNPAHRMVIVNGEVLHEGDTAAPELVLERIEANRTVWRFKEWRYAMPMQ